MNYRVLQGPAAKNETSPPRQTKDYQEMNYRALQGPAHPPIAEHPPKFTVHLPNSVETIVHESWLRATFVIHLLG
jgi:hypothetical protein